MAQGVTRTELRKIRAIVALIGQENLYSISSNEYQCVRGLHVYTLKNEDDELALSIWNEPRDNQSSQCLFADRISVHAFNAALAYWKPRYQSGSSVRVE